MRAAALEPTNRETADPGTNDDDRLTLANCSGSTSGGAAFYTDYFTDVRDAVEGLVRLADCDEAVGETVNIGSRFEFSIREMAQHVKTVTIRDSAIEMVPYEYDIVPSCVPCLSKARRLIGYSAVHPVRDSIREIVALDDGAITPGLA